MGNGRGEATQQGMPSCLVNSHRADEEEMLKGKEREENKPSPRETDIILLQVTWNTHIHSFCCLKLEFRA